MPWVESNRVFTWSPHSGPTVIFSGDNVSASDPRNYAPGQWHTIDLKPLGVSADATFAEITGFLIITDQGPEIDNLTATFRRPGGTLHEGNYQMQAISVFSGDGARQVQSVTVPLVNGCFEFFWQKTVGGVPENGHPSSFLLNLWLSKWGLLANEATDPSALTELQGAVGAQGAAIAGIQSAVDGQAQALAEVLSRLQALEAAPPPAPSGDPMVVHVPPGGAVLHLVRV